MSLFQFPFEVVFVKLSVIDYWRNTIVVEEVEIDHSLRNNWFDRDKIQETKKNSKNSFRFLARTRDELKFWKFSKKFKWNLFKTFKAVFKKQWFQKTSSFIFGFSDRKCHAITIKKLPWRSKNFHDDHTSFSDDQKTSMTITQASVTIKNHPF